MNFKTIVPAILAWVIGIFAVTAVAGTPQVQNVTAKQRFPWNGLVDITCKVTGISGTTNGLYFSVAAVMPDTGNARTASNVWVVKDGTTSTDLEVHANGNYRLLWDARAELGQVRHANMVVRVTLRNPTAHDKVQLWAGGPYWATTNIGADEPWEYGYNFWWGDTVGYTRSGGTWTDYGDGSGYYSNVTWVSSTGQQMSSSPFDWDSCPTTYKDDPALLSEGYIDATGNLAPEHDAPHVHWGGEARMPTDAEISALIDNCTTTWITTNGVYGRLVTGKGAYANRSIFLPAAGLGSDSDHYYPGSDGSYWSSTPDSDSSYYAWSLNFNAGDFYRYSYCFGRYDGRSVRPVRDDGGTANTYTVTYKPGANGNGTQQTATKMHGVALKLKGATFTRSGYTQTGWSTSDGGSKAYDLGASYTANAPITLYPYWTVNSGADTHASVQLWAGGPYWATTNIGAEEPWEYGYYFWWGDTVGYTRSGGTWTDYGDGLGYYSDVTWVSSTGQQMSSCPFDWDSCPTMYKDDSALLSEGYIDVTGNLAPEHDAAHVQWGGSWRMPTKQELSDLNNKCSWSWTTMNGIKGWRVSGTGDYASASIFLPCAGGGLGTSLYYVGSVGYYWSSAPYSDDYGYAWLLYFTSSRHDTNGSSYRSVGQPVRPVQGFTE